MAYENREEHARVFRHTVRFKKADQQLLAVLAARLGMQKATLIESMAMRAAEKALQDLGLMGDAPPANAAQLGR
ncbi:hypothetical protein [Acidovorax sp. SUPP2825]|uniref:hypothetical protein n=1 Tax=Acidovorax sp. SUPP2825 TaxID=2920879 RepID=UPI0023DE3338|nr:hypothetical protein [Acidovorax sp. SUPP2825]GKS93214.1 hypothetical protein AVAK2825_01785 [Acidovorax sp. SUPP2825]